MTNMFFHSDPGRAGKGENIDGWLTLEIHSLGVFACVHLFTVTLSMYVQAEETCREEKKGVRGDTVRAREVAKTISARERLGTSK